MKKTILISILTILLIASFATAITREQITKPESINTIDTKGTIEPILFRKTVEIISANNKWITSYNIKTNVVPLMNFTDEDGVYHYSPTGNRVCESMGLKCLSMDYKTTSEGGFDPANVWVKINYSILDIQPCDFVNMTEQKSYSDSTLYRPYGAFFHGINRVWDNFAVNTTRGAEFYNFTFVNMTDTQVTFTVGLRYKPETKPQTKTFGLAEKTYFDEKENTILFVRGIDAVNKKINITIVQEATSSFRANCGIPTAQRLTR